MLTGEQKRRLLSEAIHSIRLNAMAALHFTAPWRVGTTDMAFTIEYATTNPDAGHIALCADYVPLEAADHVAAWNPEVAVAVAQFLEFAYDHWNAHPSLRDPAMNVVHAYLGTASAASQPSTA